MLLEHAHRVLEHDRVVVEPRLEVRHRRHRGDRGPKEKPLKIQQSINDVSMSQPERGATSRLTWRFFFELESIRSPNR